MSTENAVFSRAFAECDVGDIILSDTADDDTAVHAPATLLVTTSLKKLMMDYLETVKRVAKTEGLLFQQTATRVMVDSVHIEQTNRGTLRHMAWRESVPTVFFSPCANAAGVSQSTKRKCSACAVQVLINTACLRAFCFCVLIGTNALESFNGSIAAMISKRSDYYISHVGRAQLALMKRCYPGGYREVVRRLRAACGLAALTPQAEAATAVHQRKATRATIKNPIFSSVQHSERGVYLRKKKAARSKTQGSDGMLLKAANLGRQQKILEAEGCPAVAGGKKKGGKGQSGPGATDEYDRTGSNIESNMRAATVNPAKPSTKERAKGVRVCRTCTGFGVPADVLGREEHRRASKKKCQEVQQRWRSEAASATPSTAPTAPTTTPRAGNKRKRGAGSAAGASAAGRRSSGRRERAGVTGGGACRDGGGVPTALVRSGRVRGLSQRAVEAAESLRLQEESESDPESVEVDSENEAEEPGDPESCDESEGGSGGGGGSSEYDACDDSDA